MSAEANGRWPRSSVTDRGPGVPAAERERVLDRFVRLEASRSEPGSGLGLSLVAAVARLHGGSLRLEDNEPGLRVVLALPANAEALVNGAATSCALGSRDQAGVTAFFERISEPPWSSTRRAAPMCWKACPRRWPTSPDLAPAAKLVGESPKLRALLQATFSCSPYLSSLALRDPATLAECVLPRSGCASRRCARRACRGDRRGPIDQGGHGAA